MFPHLEIGGGGSPDIKIAFGSNGLENRIVKNITLPEKIRYITPDLIQGSLHFGRNELDTDHKDVNTILQDRVFLEYQKAWRSMQ